MKEKRHPRTENRGSQIFMLGGPFDSLCGWLSLGASLALTSADIATGEFSLRGSAGNRGLQKKSHALLSQGKPNLNGMTQFSRQLSDGCRAMCPAMCPTMSPAIYPAIRKPMPNQNARMMLTWVVFPVLVDYGSFTPGKLKAMPTVMPHIRKRRCGEMLKYWRCPADLDVAATLFRCIARVRNH